jgi:hypothetical protein
LPRCKPTATAAADLGVVRVIGVESVHLVAALFITAFIFAILLSRLL